MLNFIDKSDTNEEKKSQKLSESIQVEELFIKQKDKIKHYKEMLERENKIIYKNDTSLNQEKNKNYDIEKSNFFPGQSQNSLIQNQSSILVVIHSFFVHFSFYYL